MAGSKQLMKLCLLRNTKYTIGSKKLKMTINQDPVEVHQRNHQGEAPRNLKVLQRPSRQEALEEKLKMAELLAEASFTEEKHADICNAEKLRQTEELAKLKARSQIFDEVENDRYLSDRYVERNNPTLMEGKTQTSIIPKIEKDGLMDRARNLSEIRNMNSNSNNKEGCQKEADIKAT